MLQGDPNSIIISRHMGNPNDPPIGPSPTLTLVHYIGIVEKGSVGICIFSLENKLKPKNTSDSRWVTRPSAPNISPHFPSTDGAIGTIQASAGYSVTTLDPLQALSKSELAFGYYSGVVFAVLSLSRVRFPAAMLGYLGIPRPQYLPTPTSSEALLDPPPKGLFEMAHHRARSDWRPDAPSTTPGVRHTWQGISEIASGVSSRPEQHTYCGVDGS
ncbi:hypothetical protein FPV67DRAFT_1461979 [Lyophyllum atratum]|nr:hypothetical protein FPV67DRAFT_1461979 [Lyophyllum atratum]